MQANDVRLRSGEEVFVPTVPGTRENAEGFWRDLLDGRFSLEREYCQGDRCYGVFSRRNEQSARVYRLPAGRAAVLERMIDGHSQKVIAIDMKRSNSCVAVTLADCRRRFGVKCRSSAFPLVLALTALASRSRAPLLWSHQPGCGEAAMHVISLPRPDTKKLVGLTPAEAEVLSQWLEGRSQNHIAGLRHACRRTVVNQLAAARRKLAGSGRMQLLQWLLLFEEREDPLRDVVTTARARQVERHRRRNSFESAPIVP